MAARSFGGIDVTATGLRRSPLVLLHALPLDSRMWAAQLRALEPLGNVLAPDLPGFGSTPAPAAEPSLDVWARRLRDWLTARGVEQAVFAGCSMGGYVALAMMRVAPEMVTGVALVGSRTAADTPEQRAARYAGIERIKREGMSARAREFADQALSPWTRQHKPEVADLVVRFAMAQPAESVIVAQQALAERPDSTQLWHSGPPDAGHKLIVHGADDKIVPLDEAAALARSSMTQCVAVQNAGHLAPMEQPDQVTNAIDELWLRCETS